MSLISCQSQYIVHHFISREMFHPVFLPIFVIVKGMDEEYILIPDMGYVEDR